MLYVLDASLEYAVERQNIDQIFKQYLKIFIIYTTCLVVAIIAIVSNDGILLIKVALDIIQLCLNCSRLIAATAFLGVCGAYASICFVAGFIPVIEMYLGLHVGKHILDKSISLRYK